MLARNARQIAAARQSAPTAADSMTAIRRPGNYRSSRARDEDERLRTVRDGLPQRQSTMYATAGYVTPGEDVADFIARATMRGHTTREINRSIAVFWRSFRSRSQ